MLRTFFKGLAPVVVMLAFGCMLPSRPVSADVSSGPPQALGATSSPTFAGLTLNGSLAQGFTTGSLVIPKCATGAPSGAAPEGTCVEGGDNHFYVRMNGAWVKVDGAGGGSSTNPIYGDGSDGAAVLDGVATVTWATLSGGNTYDMTRDCICSALTVNNGITLHPNNCQVYGGASITVNAGGVISSNGGAASGTAHGDSPTQAAGAWAAGGSGGNGGNGAAAGGSASPTTGSASVGGSGGVGGISGAGHAGGTKCTITQPPAQSVGLTHTYVTASTFGLLDGGAYLTSTICGGGGSGGGSEVASTGGGGGSGADGFGMFALAITNNGTISANGGAGADATGVAAGGGGGGGGGAIWGVCSTYTGSSGTVTGGAGGAKVGTGVAGVAGSPGHFYKITGY